MQVVNVAEMQALDRRAIEELGIPSLVLMERASLGIYHHLKHFYKNQLQSKKPVLILAGSGNNGGDGLVIARLLHCDNYSVQVILLGKDKKRSIDNKHQLELIRRLEIPTHSINHGYELEPYLESCNLIVDALFGVGLSRPLTGIYADIIQRVNQASTAVVAVDIPSGIDGNTGMVLGAALRADLTVSCAFAKYGLLMDTTLEYIGHLRVVDIGIPPEYSRDIKNVLITAELISQLVPPPRSRHTHKGTYGKLAIVAGSLTMSGAAVLATKAALQSGVGIVYTLVPHSIHASVAVQVPGALVIPLPELEGQVCKDSLSNILDKLSSCQAIVIGPGLGSGHGVRALLQELLPSLSIPCLIDADGLNHLQSIDVTLPTECVITPHVGEMSRLLNCSTLEVQSNRVESTRKAVTAYQSVCVLKGANSIISDREHSIYINSETGNPALARGGSGDILSGLIGGLLAQGISPCHASILGVYWHGLAGDKAAVVKPSPNVLMEDVLSALPVAYQAIIGS